MIRFAFMLSIAFSLCLFTSCNKKDEGTGTAGGAAPSATTPPAPANLAFKKLGTQPLEAQVPDAAKIDDATATAGFPCVTIYGAPGTVFVFGGGSEMSDVKPTMDETKKSLDKDPNKLKKYTREEKTADGWILEYDRESMIDKQPLYGVSVRRTIGGVAWDVSTNADSKELRDAAEKVGLSLRAAK